ncbi:phage major capsid protein [Rhodoplanes elegans]|uniref:Phage major capsid protein n=1 Tax=Rhodoplanes elegans TaxID=29408 RepID=A0A327L2R2_9BRAD|nr:phage major capsid protein [Rhodoplanes elegans]MBK5958103.1 phage major capsid protein [Rhodoplanes elegans]MBK5958195.1 phage major capsid protein [Rhodoplanes elegans]RAI41978.1 phage major capsid protein [Rhodoplanes elegans]
MEDAKQAIDGLMTAFEEFKSTNDARLKEIEKKGTADPVVTDKLSKIENTIAGFEGINQRLTQAEAQKKALDDLKSQFDAIELKVGRIVGKPRDEGEKKGRVETWLRAAWRAHAVGKTNLSADEAKALDAVETEMKALNVGTDTAGGFLAPTEYVREIIKGITDVSPVRSLVRVRPTANKAIQIPARRGQFAAQRVGEQGTRTETTGLTYGLEEITAPEMYALVDISRQMIDDAAFDMEGEIRMEAEEQFAVKEGAEFVSGTGVGQLEGILSNSSVAETNSGAATAIAADGMINLFHGIKTAYTRNATWVLNRTTLGSVRKLKDTTNQYLWQPGVANGVPNSILGAPYVEVPDMPNEAANAYPVAFGDFRRAYTLVDRIVMELLRDPYTQATSGNIRFQFWKRVGGKVTLAEAIRKMKCST